MPDLRKTRKNLKIVIAVMAGIDLLALAAYVSPLIGSADSRRQQMNLLQTELNAKTRQVEPLKNLPQKVTLANRQIVDFYKQRFPSESSQIATELGKLSVAEGITIEQVKYKELEGESAKLRPIEMEADLSGNYVALAKFINAVERDQMFFTINSIALGGAQQGPVKLGMKLETYLKEGTP
ncbi:MAG: type 4a pilus biogenesis protein PilO [Candidatus Sulfotelmatobacter sp.]